MSGAPVPKRIEEDPATASLQLLAYTQQLQAFELQQAAYTVQLVGHYIRIFFSVHYNHRLCQQDCWQRQEGLWPHS